MFKLFDRRKILTGFDNARPMQIALLLTAISGYMGGSTIYERLSLEVDGTVVSKTTTCLPGGSRCGSVYNLDALAGRQQVDASGAAGASLERNIAIGSQVVKFKSEWGYRVNGTKINDFPFVIYFSLIGISLIFVCVAVSTYRSQLARKQSVGRGAIEDT